MMDLKNIQKDFTVALKVYDKEHRKLDFWQHSSRSGYFKWEFIYMGIPI